MAKKIRGHGEGSIYQRQSGSWRAQISRGGKRLGRTFKRKSDALKWLRNTQIELERGRTVDGGKLKLSEYLAEWLAQRQASLRPGTIVQYRQIIRDYILPQLGKIQLKDLRLSGVERHYTDLISAGASKRTVRKVHAVLHAAFEKAIKYGHVAYNPTHGAALPRYSHNEMQVLDADQVVQLLKAAVGSRYETLYHLAIHTGMRQGELFGLVWGDLDWTNSELAVKRQVKRPSGGGWVFADPKTKRGRRKIRLGAGMRGRLKAHRQEVEKMRSVAGSRWQDNNLILPTTVGSPLYQSNMRKDFLQVLDGARLPKIRFHDLRHTAASLMLNHGVALIAVSKILGHSKPSTTLDIYGHIYQDIQSDAAIIMDNLVPSIGRETGDAGENTAVENSLGE